MIIVQYFVTTLSWFIKMLAVNVFKKNSSRFAETSTDSDDIICLQIQIWVNRASSRLVSHQVSHWTAADSHKLSAKTNRENTEKNRF